MNIGDKVRIISGTEEGIITKFLENNIVEIETSDGFNIPVMKGELVVVSAEEDRYFGKEKPQLTYEAPKDYKPTKKESIVGDGLYLAYTHFNDRLLNVYFINYTKYALLLSVSEELEHGKEKFLFAEVVGKEKAPRIHRLNREEFEHWRPLIIRAVFFKRGEYEPRDNFYFRKTYSKNFFRTKRTAPVIEKESYLFRLEGREIQPTQAATKMQTIDVNQLKERMIEGMGSQTSYNIIAPAKEIDLHIEVLEPEHYDVMTSESIITRQLSHFEKTLDQALGANMGKIIFIHGIGNGVLRREIHKRLGGHAHVKYYEDAYKEKFGYGATSVTFK